MCGIAGVFDAALSKDDLKRSITRMTDALVLRGPDAGETWTAPSTPFALGHRRLSIIDLTETGRQPMTSASGRYVIVFNGEIYNFSELRAQLEQLGYPFRGRSDTEVLLAGFEHWGIKKTLVETRGMFAIALWDQQEKLLTLARDRAGEKPLYYGWNEGAFLFGSELKALRRHARWNGSVDSRALASYFRYNYVPTPYSIFEGIRKLKPGTFLTLDLDSQNNLPEPEEYWSIEQVARSGQAHPFGGTESEAKEELKKLLRRSVAQQMVADVPIGAFLSGGVDSSLIVALMQQESSRPIKTFTIGFNQKTFDEAPYAKEVAKHIGTDHTELYVTEKEAMDVVPMLGEIYDEPFADSSQIPTYLVSKLARQHVTVSLSGDAGDELFGGYNRYVWTEQIWRKKRQIPLPLRKVSSELIKRFSPASIDAIIEHTQGLLPSALRGNLMGTKLHKIADLLPLNTPAEHYLKLLSHWDPPSQIVHDAEEYPLRQSKADEWPKLNSVREQMMLLDFTHYLPDDILVKVDRAAMAVSLETRVPLLSADIIEFSWRLPDAFKITESRSKKILRSALDDYVPAHLIERPKTGFGVPLGKWLRTDLRDWAESLVHLSKSSAPLLNVQTVTRHWNQLLKGDDSSVYALWTVLMYLQWENTHS